MAIVYGALALFYAGNSDIFKALGVEESKNVIQMICETVCEAAYDEGAVMECFVGMRVFWDAILRLLPGHN